MQVNGLILADLHFGAIDPEEFQDQINTGLFRYIMDLDNKGESLDYIIIAGDLFDTKETFSSIVVQKVIFTLFTTLFLTDKWATEIIIIEGTRTHDNMQLDTLNEIFSHMYDFYDSRITVVNNVSDDMIRGMKTLFIPEEYVLDKESYYREWLSDPNKYDLIVGHGMIDKIWYANENKSNKNDLVKHLSSPVFTLEELLNAGNRCYFGHIHTNKAYGENGRFKYIGPYTRWEFGSTTKVGFYHLSFDTETKEFAETYIENENAKNYPTVALSINESITLTDLNDKLDSMLAEVYIKVRNIAKVRVVVNLSQKVQNWQSIKDFLVSKFGDMNSVKFILTVEENEELVEELKETVQANRYVFDHSIDIPQRVQLFIRNKSGRDIPIEKIRYYLGEVDKR